MLEFKFPILKAMYFSCWAFSIIWFFRSRKKVVDNPLSDVCLYHNMRKYASSLQLIRNVNVKGLYIMHHLYEYNFSFSKVPIIGWTTSITNKNKYLFFQILVSKYCQIIFCPRKTRAQQFIKSSTSFKSKMVQLNLFELC